MNRYIILLVFSFVLSIPAFAVDDVMIKASDYPEGGGMEIPVTDSVVLNTQLQLWPARDHRRALHRR